jgi:hypothetical protein
MVSDPNLLKWCLTPIYLAAAIIAFLALASYTRKEEKMVSDPNLFHHMTLPRQLVCHITEGQQDVNRCATAEYDPANTAHNVTYGWFAEFGNAPSKRRDGSDCSQKKVPSKFRVGRLVHLWLYRFECSLLGQKNWGTYTADLL